MSALDVAAGGIAGLAAKATLVLCLALALAWLARRGSARTLHLLWTTTSVVLLALPLVRLLGPSWPVPILPARDVQAGMPSLDGKIEEAEARVEEFDADGRIDEIERALEDKIAALRRNIMTRWEVGDHDAAWSNRAGHDFVAVNAGGLAKGPSRARSSDM